MLARIHSQIYKYLKQHFTVCYYIGAVIRPCDKPVAVLCKYRSANRRRIGKNVPCGKSAQLHCCDLVMRYREQLCHHIGQTLSLA